MFNIMKILYYIPFITVGADRWIYEGWRDAFIDMGHDFIEMRASDEPKRILGMRPDIFLVANFMDLKKYKDFLCALRKNGTVIAMAIDWPMDDTRLAMIRDFDIADIYFGEREVESIIDFERATGHAYHLIPNAANKLLHYPKAPEKKYEYDIVYLGAKLPKKKNFFESVLYPLMKRYSVGVFGPYWTVKDNILRSGSKLCKALSFSRGVSYLDALRITIPPEDESALYSSAKISLNFHEREEDGTQPHYILNQRTFKIPACGGFELCDYVPALRRYFTEGEVVMARDPKDWMDKVDHFLSHQSERDRIRRAGMQRALADHTYHQRVDLLFRICGK